MASGTVSTCEGSGGELSGPDHSPNKSQTDMPTRKNKRKLSEPRRRSDISMKRACAQSPGSVSDHSVVSDVSDGGSKDDPRDLPGGGFLDHGDSSQGPSGKATTPLTFGERVSCMVPNLYFPTGLGRSPEAFGIPLPFEGGGLHFDPRRQLESHHQLPGNYGTLGECDGDEGGDEDSSCVRGGKRPRKNYKNMTRERRIEANARERTRVHTISAAFESLRRAVPSYSYNQKLSKLAILRIACTYIMALGKLADVDYTTDSNDGTQMDFGECVDLCTRTIQTEGRARRRH